MTDPLMPATLLADFWSQLASVYVHQPNVIFGLMNEPHVQTPVEWKAAAVAAVQAIRSTGAKQKILIPGTAWSGAQSWVSSGNASVWSDFADSNFAFEVHQYLDSDNSGSHTECVTNKGSQTLVEFAIWARSHKVQAFIGEAGWSTADSCGPEGNGLLSYVKSNSDVFVGLTYWAGGPWLGTYMYSVEPVGLGTGQVSHKPQMLQILNIFN